MGAALLFGLSAPLAKLLLLEIPPLTLGALLYLGGGAGLLLLSPSKEAQARITRRDLPLMAGITLCGGVLGPLLMLTGLSRLSAVATSLLLNLEGPLTILLALSLFGEHLGLLGIMGAALVFGGAGLVALKPGEIHGDAVGVVLVAAACLAWGVDNNLTQRLSFKDPVSVVRLKALGAGGCLLAMALLRGQPMPGFVVVLKALALGSASYGLSIVLDLYALRLVGAAREAAYFATAPFMGALASVVLLRERLLRIDIIAGAVMALGVSLLLRERHSHLHTHEPLDHIHLHLHDEHHQHAHEGPFTEPHTHRHVHAPLTHDHPHVSDLHHRHSHRKG
jgi:drug/metabolite transporter (DMT)-like permease